MTVDDEYEAAAEYCAERGIIVGSELMPPLSEACSELIAIAPEEFSARIRDYSYAIAMARIHGDQP